jgi:hypothetical protein
MRIIHRIGKNVDRHIQQWLSERGIAVELGDQTFIVDEDDPTWPVWTEFLAEWHPPDLVCTEFTQAECAAARYLEFAGSWHHGYPMPDDDFGYREATYDLSSFCRKCGIGKTQNAPFRLRNEPRWGTRHIMGLNWVFEAVFVRPEVWKDTFQPFGIEAMEVLHHRTGKPLQTVVQLLPQDVAVPPLDIGEARFYVCASCGKKKYSPVSRGFFPRLSEECKGHCFHTIESFGSGASANKAVIVSGELYDAVTQRKLKGGAFTPLAE